MKILLALLFTLPVFATDRIEIPREDGTFLPCYLDTPEADSYSITLIIPGSQKETSLKTHDALKEALGSIGKCSLTLEKQGINGEKIDEKEFNKGNTIDERVASHLAVLKNLKTLQPKWNGKISILGQGDGGRIGAKLATQIGSVEAIILIASGGAWPPMDEALYAFRSEMADDSYSPQYIHGFLVAARQEFAQALETPKPDHKAFGYSYKYWASLLKSNLMEDLSKIKCPIYSVNGVMDNRVPIESVDFMAKCLKDRLTLNRKEKVGRELIQDHEVYSEAISWLSLPQQ